MAENAVVAWLLAHWGTFGGSLGLVVLLLLRFGPDYIRGLREKRLAVQQERIQRRSSDSLRESALQGRLDAKDAQLTTILTNHIAHLEEELKLTRAFHVAIVAEIQKHGVDLARAEKTLNDAAEDLEDVKTVVHEIRAAQ